MNIKKRLKKLEKIISVSDIRPVLIVFAVIDEEWQSGERDRDFSGIAFERYLSWGKIPDISRIKDLEDLKQIAIKNMINLQVLPVISLEDVWAEERRELENESSFHDSLTHT